LLAFGQRARDAGIAISMGSPGDCFDDAVAESFFAPRIAFVGVHGYGGQSMSSVRVELSPRLTLDGRLFVSETLLAAAGAHLLVLSKSIGELGVTLHSSYLGHPGTDTIASGSKRTEPCWCCAPGRGRWSSGRTSTWTPRASLPSTAAH